jgi:hypothetical protein
VRYPLPWKLLFLSRWLSVEVHFTWPSKLEYSPTRPVFRTALAQVSTFMARDSTQSALLSVQLQQQHWAQPSWLSIRVLVSFQSIQVILLQLEHMQLP